MAEKDDIEDDVEVTDMTEEELAAADTEATTATTEATEEEDTPMVDDDMLADMLDQASDAPGEDTPMVDDDMLADMLDQASDAPGEDSPMVDEDMLADMLDQASDGPDGDSPMVDDDMLADMLDQASDDEPKEQALDSEGNPMDDDMAAMWGDALGEQATAAEKFDKGAVVKSDDVDYKEVDYDKLAAESGTQLNLDIIMDVPITISMEVGRTQAPIRNLLQLNQGSVIELDRLAGESLDVMVNGCLIAHGEVVVVNEKFGIRLTDIVSVDERVKKIAL